MLFKSLKNFSLIACFLSSWVMIIVPMEKPDKPKLDKALYDALLRDESGGDCDNNDIQEFIKNGGDANQRDEQGRTLLELALEHKKHAVAYFLFYHGGIMEIGESQPLPDNVRNAFYLDDIEIVEMVLREIRLDKLKTLKKGIDWPLALAVSQARPKAVSALLISLHRQFESANKFLETHAAALDFIVKHTTLSEDQRTRYKQIRYLLKGTNIHTAIENGDGTFVDTYIEDCGDVNAPNKKGTTPLEIALQREQHAIARILLLNGARSDSTYLPFDDIFSHHPDAPSIARSIFDSDHVIDHVTKDQKHLPFALQFSISQGRRKSVEKLLNLKEQLDDLGFYLELVHRILQSTPHNSGQRPRYKAILDLLRMHGSRSQLIHAHQPRLLEIAHQLGDLLTVAHHSERLSEFLQNPAQIPPRIQSNPREPQ